MADGEHINLSRRGLLQAGAAVGGGLIVGIEINGPAQAAASGKAFEPHAFIQIGRDGMVTLVMPKVEMGQGIYTALTLLIAEELEADLDRVRLAHSPADEKKFGVPPLGQTTGGSTSIRSLWEPTRKAGAVARTLLIAAAAEQWKVGADDCRANNCQVLHVSTGRKLDYAALVDRAAKLPAPEKVVLKDPKDFRLVGKSHHRLEGPSKVDGTAMFGIDAHVPGMKIVTMASSPVFGGKLVSVDEAPALAVKGVRQVVRLPNAVCVVADHMGAAKKGLAALKPVWDEGPNAKVQQADIIAALDKAAAAPGAVARSEGDAARTLAGAAKKVEAVYHQPFLAHATMEPPNCTVRLTKDSCELWTGTQIQGGAVAIAAQVAGLPVEKVVLHNQYIGGGFGRRLEVDMIEQAVAIAKQVDAPVKVVWSREEDVQHDYYRPAYVDRIAAGLGADGKPVAWTHSIAGSSVLARFAPPAMIATKGVDTDVVECATEPVYAVGDIHVEFCRAEPPGVTTGWWRGVGPTRTLFVVESFIDECAAAAGADPVAYRQALLKSPRAKAVLDLAATKAGWGQPLPASRGRGVSVQFAFGTYLAQVAEVEMVSGQVRVRKVVTAIDCGVAINPDHVRAQMEGGAIFGMSMALWGAIDIRDGRVAQRNFNDYRVARMDEAPVIETHLITSAESPGGIGETSTAGIAPAIFNAVFAATGKRVRELPLSKASFGV